ncbi:RUS1 family protein C16orf58 homolog, partial [Rhincodon typus]|uniref:RUS1 family protein C16orf58 homolog n=1 Tax=Rhincodon typus TaxID=259920 RepID=UPI002030F49A
LFSLRSTLDCDAKKWRLFADILNDLAIFIEIIAPAFPSFFTLIVCTSGVFKSIVGVSGGATRAALTVHQAQRDNMADVSAKDGSQETLVNLIGLACSLILTPLISDNIVYVGILLKGAVCVSLREGADSVDVIHAAFHAEVLHHLLYGEVHTFSVESSTFTELRRKAVSAQDERLWDVVAATHLLVDQLFPRLLTEARAAGWVTDRNHLGADEWRARWAPGEGKKGQ